MSEAEAFLVDLHSEIAEEVGQMFPGEPVRQAEEGLAALHWMIRMKIHSLAGEARNQFIADLLEVEVEGIGSMEPDSLRALRADWAQGIAELQEAV